MNDESIRGLSSIRFDRTAGAINNTLTKNWKWKEQRQRRIVPENQNKKNYEESQLLAHRHEIHKLGIANKTHRFGIKPYVLRFQFYHVSDVHVHFYSLAFRFYFVGIWFWIRFNDTSHTWTHEKYENRNETK